MSEVSTDKKLKGKDLITIVSFPQSTLSSTLPSCFWEVFTPVLWMLMPGFIAVFAGIPFMLMVAKGSKTGCSFPDGAYPLLLSILSLDNLPL